MALRLKKVAGKRTNRGFCAKNAGVIFGKFWLQTGRRARISGPFLDNLRSGGRRVNESLLHRKNAVDAFGQVRQVSFVTAA